MKWLVLLIPFIFSQQLPLGGIPIVSGGNSFGAPVVCTPMAAAVETTAGTLTTATCTMTGTKLVAIGINSILGTNTNATITSPGNTVTCNAQNTVSGNGSVQTCYVLNATVSSSMTVAVTTTGGTTRLSIGFMGWPDTGTPTFFNFSNGLSGAGTTATASSLTPSASGAVCFASYSGNGLSGTTPTVAAPLTLGGSNTATFDSAFAYVQQTTAVAVAASFTGADTQTSVQQECFLP